MPSDWWGSQRSRKYIVQGDLQRPELIGAGKEMVYTHLPGLDHLRPTSLYDESLGSSFTPGMFCFRPSPSKYSRARNHWSPKMSDRFLVSSEQAAESGKQRTTNFVEIELRASFLADERFVRGTVIDFNRAIFPLGECIVSDQPSEYIKLLSYGIRVILVAALRF
nr:hypothetical protein Iba_chr09bCG11750 [Ipomoea batatas]